MRRGETGGFGDAVKKQYLVAWRDDEDTVDGKYNAWPQPKWYGWSFIYLALGRGTGGTFGACLSGLWSVDVDMFRWCILIVSCTISLQLDVAVVAMRRTEGGNACRRCAAMRRGYLSLCISTSRCSIREKVDRLGFGIISHEWSRQWALARHCVRFVKPGGRGEMPRLLMSGSDLAQKSRAPRARAT
jgi:hypothetical protein